MLDNDIFVRHRSCNADSVNDIKDYINRCFNCSAGDGTDAVLVLAAYCVYISYEEIYGTFTLHSRKIEQKVIPLLLKKGFLVKCPARGNGSVTRTYFRITPAGFKAANELCFGMNPNSFKKMRTKSGDGRFADHIYLSGYNLFAVISFGIPFEWRREFPYTNGRGYSGPRTKGDLIVDAMCAFYPGDPSRYRIAYFEEDTGSEDVGTLLGKLEKYRKYHLMDELRDMVVFSFYSNMSDPSQSPRADAFATTKCLELFNYMKNHGISNAVFLAGNSDVDQEYLKSILIATGAARMDGNGRVVRTKYNLTLDRVGEFYSSLLFRRNPFQCREFNLRHASFAFRRMQRMAGFILSRLSSLPLFAREMAKGFPVYCMATTLVSERLPYGMLSDFKELSGKLSDSFSSSFGETSFLKELSERLTVSRNGDYIRLRNAFSYYYGGQQGTVAAEFMSFDLGAWIRAVMFLNYINSEWDTVPVQFICIFDTLEHYRGFLRLVKKIPEQGPPDGARSGIYGLMAKDIGIPGKIFRLEEKT